MKLIIAITMLLLFPVAASLLDAAAFKSGSQTCPNPTATIDFPANSTCILSDTLLLSSQTPLRRFGGHLRGNGSTYTVTQNNASLLSVTPATVANQYIRR